MTLSTATKSKIIARFEKIAQLMRRRAGRRGTRLAVVVQHISDAFPKDRVFHLLDVVGHSLAKRTDELVLITGKHTDVQDQIRDLNRAGKVWLTTFMGPAQGNTITRQLVVEIEQSAADFIFESHHVVEARLRTRYPELRNAFASGDEMITVAIPSGLHRGARYAPLEARTVKLKQLRDALPDRDFNLTALLMTKFDDAYFATPGKDYRTFLTELSGFYKQHLPEMYKPAGPAATHGIHAALVQIATKTGVSPSILVP
ncbi:hypothetical protein AB0M36_06880 [Actinoplanes sp. NPDC051346]|uniref:hypothetical protein n=1 Tax=Actinoplanes sp. NPDC051346 TaxID=3155048 RepID=UPI00342BD926